MSVLIYCSKVPTNGIDSIQISGVGINVIFYYYFLLHSNTVLLYVNIFNSMCSHNGDWVVCKLNDYVSVVWWLVFYLTVPGSQQGNVMGEAIPSPEPLLAAPYFIAFK